MDAKGWKDSLGILIHNYLCKMTRTKLMVPTMRNTIWCILEYLGVDMRAIKDELKRADLVAKLRIRQKVDRVVDLMPTHTTSQ